ncbi:MFS transporter [Geminicoccus harenae]|uniref:MFS transporter n=1 Tax=Geminicoccus harenae TaxID=2498453 RepID=UPI00168A88EC|nr:MFS transporter [Geminicoccus harenae]
MTRTILSAWSLLLGMGLLMLGHGLQGTLLPLRAAHEGFALSATGIMMSAYYLGLVAAPFIVPHFVGSVGHVRVFAALASLASGIILIHILLVDPITWFFLRFTTGLALCGVYITAESWLNSKADNRTRGGLFSFYMVVQTGGFAAGNFLLNLAPVQSWQLFAFVSVLFSIGLMPILLADNQAPPPSRPVHVGFRELWRLSPLGLVTIFGIGIAQGGLYAMGPIWARAFGMSIATVSLFMAVTLIGGALFQLPIGRLSDWLDRRLVITAVTFGAALSSALVVFADPGNEMLVLGLFFLFGGLSLPMYSLGVAHTNDFMRPDQLVGVSGALLLTNGLGAAIGPTLTSFVMEHVGIYAFPLLLAVAHAAIGLFALWRMTRRRAPNAIERGPAQAIPTGSPYSTVLTQEVSATRREEAQAVRQEEPAEA